jgi:glycosidase
MLLFATIGNAQLLSWSPSFIQESASTVDIICDANLGNTGIKNYTPTSDIYVHIGAITTASANSSDWKGVPFTWATTPPNGNAVYLGANKWKFTITGGLRNFFNITNASEKIVRIAILFRNGAGTKVLRNADGSDLYVPVYDNGLYTRIENPFRTPYYNMGTDVITKVVGDIITIASTASQTSTIKLFFNGNLLTTNTAATTATTATTIANTGVQTIISEANDGVNTVYDTVKFLVAPPVTIAALPTGITKDGIYYDAADPTFATLVIYGLGKTTVSVVGDFNNWTETLIHQMNKTPDGKYFWLKLTGLTSGQEYAYQYIIDGVLKVGDYNCEKVLDPWNDQYISAATYPALKAYPVGKTTGIVSILQTNKTPYNWQYPFTRPNKKNLMIYELLIRDFVSNHNYQTLIDSLPYLVKLGINTIQLMPVNEFEGNNSWGYNPNYFMATDKYYGTETAFKQFIDECHRYGIAVVMDIAMNHAFGSCPMVQMYWDAANNRPAANNPWFNTTDRHPYGVGYDFNHESQVTKDFVDRVLTHWLTNYKIDGFRWDLSKGFTQNTTTDVGAWGNYDASRIALWKRIYNKMQAVSPNSYCILEHFAADAEEIELSNYGMLLWGNSHGNFTDASRGSSTNTDFSRTIATNRGWTTHQLVGYAESHDEERLMYSNLTDGKSSGAYNIKDTNTALRRQEMVASFLTMIPGPKMIWQMGELGYNYSINTCSNGSINGGCRLDEKPIKWDYQTNPNRKKLYDVYAKLFALRTNPAFSPSFINALISFNLSSSSFKQITVGDANLRTVVVGNFGTTATAATVSFPNTGNWYNLFTNATNVVTGTTQSMLLQPGDYYVFTSKNVNTILSINNNPNEVVVYNNINKIKVLVKPNPVRSNSVLEYELPIYGKLNINIIDINGNTIANLVNEYKTKGSYSTSLKQLFATKHLSNGMYFLQLDFNGKKQMEKLVIAN